MTDNLFSSAPDVKTGQVWVDIEQERLKIPDPMNRVFVVRIEIGMVIISSAVFRNSKRTEAVRIDRFREKYRLESEA